MLPFGGHWNEVSYLDAFLIDSILVRHPIDLVHLMIRHMISSHSMAGRVLPYGRLFTRLFRFHGLDLTDQTDQQAPRHYDTFIASTLGRMRIPTLEALLATQPKEDEIRGIEVGVNPPERMEDDLHIPHLQTEYPHSYGEPHFSTAHPLKPPPMSSTTKFLAALTLFIVPQSLLYTTS